VWLSGRAQCFDQFGIVDAQMAETGRGGHIVNVASGLAFVPTAYSSAYHTVKAAVHSECLPIELSGESVSARSVPATPTPDSWPTSANSE
jgi:short-subunit dehydrogenase